MNKAIRAGWVLLGATLALSCATGPAPQAKDAPGSANPSKKAVVKVIETQVPRLVREEARYADGALIQAIAIKYDEQGNPLREELSNQRKALVSVKNYQYAEAGRLQTVTTTSPSGEVQGIVVREHDPKGLLLKETLLNDKKQVQSVSEYAWDAQGAPLSWTTKAPDGAMIIKTLYLGNKGRVTEIKLVDDKGQLLQAFKQDWDAQGKLIKKTELNAEGAAVQSVLYRYQGGLLEREDYVRADGTTIRSIEYVYGDKGLPSLLRFVDRKGQLTETRSQEYAFFKRTETVTVYE